MLERVEDITLQLQTKVVETHLLVELFVLLEVEGLHWTAVLPVTCFTVRAILVATAAFLIQVITLVGAALVGTQVLVVLGVTRGRMELPVLVVGVGVEQAELLYQAHRNPQAVAV